MESKRPTIVLVLKSGGDFSFQDVELIARHINGKWESSIRPRIVCLWDNASTTYNLGNLEIIPLTNDYSGTWSRIQLYSPEMEKYRPFLYIDLDTVVINSLENIFKLIEDPSQFIVLEDFWQKGQLATGLVWFPAKSKKVSIVWDSFTKESIKSSRMDNFLRKVITPDKFWQQLTETIKDFKPKGGNLLNSLPAGTDVVCFHGKPRIHTVAEGSITIDWVKDYVQQSFKKYTPNVTVIIPYKSDRGWLKDAVESVPDGVQLILSQGEGNWPQNFNKALHQATGEYIKYLHEDDMLTPNCIEDSIRTMEEQDVDFIHGEAIELYQVNGRRRNTKSSNPIPTFGNLMKNNTIHSATLMYRKKIFDQLGGFDETLSTQEEYEFNLRCLQAGFKIGYCKTSLAIYRRHPAQKVRIVPKTFIEKEKLLVLKRFKNE